MSLAVAARASVTHPQGVLLPLAPEPLNLGIEWDAENRLTAVKQGGNSLATFSYDGQGRRATKTAGGITTSYVYDDAQFLEERPGVGTPKRYVYDLGIDRPLAQSVGSATSYFLADHLGSIVQMTNSSGAATIAREYDPWGNLLQGSGTGGYAFTGREWDQEAGLYYYRARYYSSVSGRFLGEDPARDGSNLFLYAANNVVNRVDPLGLKDRKWPYNGCVTNTRGCKCDIPAIDMDNDKLYCVAPGTSTPNTRKDHVDVDFVLIDSTWYKIGVWNFDVSDKCEADDGFSPAIRKDLDDIEGKLKKLGKDLKKPCGDPK